MFFLFGLPMLLVDLLTPAVFCSGIVNLTQRRVDYITLLLSGTFTSTAPNNYPIYLAPLRVSASSSEALNRTHFSSTRTSCAPSSLSSGSLLLLFHPPSLSNPPALSHPPLLLDVDVLLTSSMESGGEGGEGWMEDQWEKW